MDGEISPREAEVLAAVGEHLSNAQIAGRLRLSVRTVESHVASLLRKYGVADRRALAAHAALRTVRPGEISRLPVGRTSFVGRGAEREAALLALADSRLVTLLGPGGMGKTRLAAVVAGEYPDGGAFVDLVPARAGHVVQAVAAALGVSERPPRPLEHTVIEHLAPGRALLVMDNCEHVIDETGALIDRVLSGCPGVRVLATSRERLGVMGERVIPVSALPLHTDARRLFLDRARAIDAAFDAPPALIDDLCARLDGMPLAIELAAARAGSLGAAGLLSAIEDRARLLSGGRGPDARHRSLRSVLDWSHELLDDEERAVFRRLSVFSGAFDLDAAAAVCPGMPLAEVADVVGRLADKSMVARHGERWRLLDTVRAYAAEQLALSAEPAGTRAARLSWAADTAPRLQERPVTGPEFDRVAGELRATLAEADDQAEPAGAAHRLARSLARLTFGRGAFAEARGHYTAAARHAGDVAEAWRDLRDAAQAAVAVADGEAAYALMMEAADLARRARPPRPDLLASALAHAVIIAVRYRPDAEETRRSQAALLAEAPPATDPHASALLLTARAWHEGGAGLARQAVAAARATGDDVLLLGALDALATATAQAGDTREAHRIGGERLKLITALPADDPASAAEIIDAFHAAGTAAIATGDLPAALTIQRRSRTEDPIGAHPYIAAPRRIRVLALSGRFDEALAHAETMWNGWRGDGSPRMTWMASAVAMAALVHGLRRSDRFELWRARATEMAGCSDPADSPELAACMAFVDARTAVHTGRFDDAESLVERAFADFAEPWWAAYARAAGAELAVAVGLPDRRARLAEAAPCAAQNDWAAACLARAGAEDAAALNAAAARWERIDAVFERACTLALIPDRAAEATATLQALGSHAPASR
ncbi:ATP-binding protein [Thermoactinospora rubra]|uniref:ATP-binding protein n=1 Tax=Thermoactinospora rubra TaxID=1088767 RepID=UPI001301C4C3|nr:LuxR C-terminal-related transcriptional regulator [Thermoactinospora rubra]